MRVEGNNDMFNLVQNRHAAARQGNDLHRDQADEAGVHAVREHLLECEATQVAAPCRNSACGVLRYTHCGERRDEIGVVEVREAHVADLRIVGPGHNL